MVSIYYNYDIIMMQIIKMAMESIFSELQHMIIIIKIHIRSESKL